MHVLVQLCNQNTSPPPNPLLSLILNGVYPGVSKDYLVHGGQAKEVTKHGKRIISMLKFVLVFLKQIKKQTKTQNPNPPVDITEMFCFSQHFLPYFLLMFLLKNYCKWQENTVFST
ncbi:ankyrin repeat domain-containing protein SOWAHB [Platysternon megacephalum]|uniref:Ankyrin repeat domain-containing protein SOWAHB n=1 Tax=Platysternon megacephalum TaxID=55544 RepID=A0A4D9EBN2_9SAUR|nr:ankyrin repeat domain-containing protein SOWAHB [Platysternon megacephalum]